MRTSIRQTVFATTAMLGLSGFAAMAAPPGAGDPTRVHASTTPSGQAATQTRAATGHSMEGTIQQRVADLRAKLQITPAQQPQWDQFAQVMLDNAKGTDERFQQRVRTMPTMSAAENMQSYAQLSAAHAQDMQKLVPAFQALYATMTDRQKGTADQVFRDDAHGGDHARRGEHAGRG